MLGQLWYLQVLEGGRLHELSEKNRIRIRPVAAPRGILFDRNGLALVDNRPAFTLSLIPICRAGTSGQFPCSFVHIVQSVPMGER